MIIKICDRCRVLPDDGLFKYRLINCEAECFDLYDLKSWINNKKTITLCMDCFHKFMKYEKK